MFKLIKKLFSAPLLCKTEDFLEVNPLLKAVFVFQSRGLPKGDILEYKLALTRKNQNIIWYENNSQIILDKISLPNDIFPKLFNLLDRNNFWKIKNELGELKDGIHYELVFVSDEKKKIVSIWNPKIGTNSYNFISELKILMGLTIVEY